MNPYQKTQAILEALKIRETSTVPEIWQWCHNHRHAITLAEVGRMMTALSDSGLITQPRRGRWEITEHGRSWPHG